MEEVLTKKKYEVFGNSWPLLRKIPVLRFLLPFCSGILWADSVDFPVRGDWMIPVLVLEFLFAVALLAFIKAGFRRRHIFGFILQVMLLLQGFCWCSLNKESGRPLHYTQFKEVSYYQGRLTTTLRERTKSFRGQIEIKSVHVNGKWQPAEGTLLAYFKKDSLLQLGFGENIIFKATPELFSPTDTSFFIKLFLRRQIYARAYIRQVHILPATAAMMSFTEMAVHCRMAICRQLQHQMGNTQEAAIAVALLVGEEISIDDEINAAYAATGTLHVLSVSGMHVGLIFFLLSFLLKPLMKHKHGKHIYYPLVMLLIWLYAFIAGAAPSIVRASTMCMFFLIAKWIDRKNQGFGALGASLFFILLVNPHNLYEPGLQLSFFAVWGIIWLQRPLIRLWVPKKWWLFKTWEMTCVSLAAQIMTLPVSLLYFGQFPNYFLLANLVVIPITTICIYGFILQLLVSPLVVLAEWVTMINTFLLKCSNMIVMEMQHWPGAVSHWKIYTVDALLLYLFIACMENWLRTKRFDMFLRLLILLNGFTLVRIIQQV
jgi:competence protein ComEC